MKVGLTIAGSDSGGGAGIQADIKAMQANGVFAASVITAVTAQNTQAVEQAYELPVSLIEAQMDAVLSDIRIDAAKTGMLSSSAIIEAVARKIDAYEIKSLIVDPVMISKSGYALLKEEAVAALKEKLLPLALLVTPNAHEAAHLGGMQVSNVDDAKEAARRIHAMGTRAVLVKGGHLQGEKEAVDVLFDGAHFHTFSAPLVPTKHTHGTGCTYAAAITANIAKGCSLRESIARAKRYVTDAIRHGLDIGHGYGPTHHFYFLEGSGIFPADDE